MGELVGEECGLARGAARRVFYLISGSGLYIRFCSFRSFERRISSAALLLNEKRCLSCKECESMLGECLEAKLGARRIRDYRLT